MNEAIGGVMMSKPSWLVKASTCAAVFLAWSFAGCAAKAPAQDDQPRSAKAAHGKDVFELTRVLDLHLAISAEEYQEMQPARVVPFSGGPGRSADKPSPSAADVHKSPNGSEFPWARGELTAGGKTFENVGVRYKGNFTYGASAAALKRSLKLDFDHFDDDRRFYGLKKINLNSGVTDPARMREVLSLAVFRAAGVPAPRTAYAKLTLTVPGKYDKEYVGLYTLIEQVDDTFLKDHFPIAKGMLLKPEGVRGLEYLGDDWRPYAERYLPKDDPSKSQRERLIGFARLVNKADDAQFNKEIGSYLDVDAFLRFLAANALLANLDSFLAFGHNYYLYLRPDTNRFVFIPWDLDLSFGAWPMGGSPEEQMDLSLVHPHAGDNKLIDRLLAIKDVNETYRKLLAELAASCLDKEKLLEDVAAVEKATAEPLASEKRAVEARKEGAGGFRFGPPGGGDMFANAPTLRTFAARRTESVAAQLAGTRKGYVPRSGFGPGPGFGPGGPPRPGQILPPFLQDMLKFSPDQKQRLQELQTDVDRKLREILTDEQKKKLRME